MAPLLRSSIGFRLPLMLAVLLSVAFGGMTAALYREIRATTLAGASARLGQAAEQLAETIALGVRARGAALTAVAARPAVLEALTSPNAEEVVAEVSSALDRLVGGAAETSIELWNREGRRALAVGAPVADLPAEAVREALSGMAGGRGTWVSPFSAPRGILRYSIGVPVLAGEAIAGFLVERRQLATPVQSIALLSGLIGDEAVLFTGNATGTLWSDLRQLLPAPPMTAIGESDLVQYERPSAPAVFARIVPVSGAPWMVAVEMPQAVVLAPVWRMLNRALVLAVVVVGLATAVGWWLSLRLTRPLEQVTAMAEAIAQERPAERLGWRRRDELGRLAASFNTMADRVEDSRRRYESLVYELEARVEARTAELTAANSELEAFTYSVSHDLRAPLRAIEGFARILGEDHGAQLPAEGARSLEVIRRNVNRMGALIDDLLDLSRVARQPLMRVPLDMTAVARAAASDVGYAEPLAPKTLVVHDLPSASGERTLVRQVFSNLVANAVKFSRPRGEQARVEVGATTAAADTVYFVRDNGVGFDTKYASKLFGVFQRLHRAEEFEGTGVGLAIVQRIVHRHGGRVWAEAEPGRGATFYFTLPDGG